jgi:hypothetical protein
MASSHEMSSAISSEHNDPLNDFLPEEAPKTMLDHALMVSAIVAIAVICGFYIDSSVASRKLRFSVFRLAFMKHH